MRGSTVHTRSRAILSLLVAISLVFSLAFFDTLSSPGVKSQKVFVKFSVHEGGGEAAVPTAVVPVDSPAPQPTLFLPDSTPMPTESPTLVPTLFMEPSPTPFAEATATVAPTLALETPTPFFEGFSPTPFETISPTPFESISPTPFSETPVPVETPNPTETPTPSESATPTVVPSPDATPLPDAGNETISPTPTLDENASGTITPAPTPAENGQGGGAGTITPAPTPENSPTPNPSPEMQANGTITPTPTPADGGQGSGAGTITPAPTPENSPAPSAEQSPTPNPTPDSTPVPENSPTPNPTPDSTPIPENSPTPNPTPENLGNDTLNVSISPTPFANESLNFTDLNGTIGLLNASNETILNATFNETQNLTIETNETANLTITPTPSPTPIPVNKSFFKGGKRRHFSLGEKVRFDFDSEFANFVAPAPTPVAEIPANDSGELENETAEGGGKGGKRLGKMLPQLAKMGGKRSRAFIVFSDGNESEEQTGSDGNGDFFELDSGRSFKPGVYKLKLSRTAADGSEETIEEEFALGLVNVNTNKSIYLPGETVGVVVGVLSSEGSRASDAAVSVLVSFADGSQRYFSTGDLSITDSYDGTYNFSFVAGSGGVYGISVHAESADVGVNDSTETSFEVRDSVPFEIIRTAPTVMWPQPQNISIFVKALQDSQNVVVHEFVPSSFNVSKTAAATSPAGTGTAELVWNVGAMAAGESRNLSYVFGEGEWNPPKLYSLGAAQITYGAEGAGANFSEARAWTIALDDWAFIHDFTFFYNTSAIRGTAYPWSNETLCANHNYNVSVRLVNLHTTSLSTSISLQYATGAVFTNTTPTTNYWHFLGTDRNPHSVTISDSDNAAQGLTQTYFNVTSNITGTYTLRSYQASQNGAVLFQSNQQDVEVQNCSGVAIANRPWRILGPDGERDWLVAGSTGTIAVPLFNYETSAQNAVNVSVRLYQGSTELSDWYLPEGNTQSSDFSGSTYGANPSFNESVLRWHVWVPDDADVGLAYTAVLNVSYPGGYHEYSRDFYLKETPVAVYVSMADRTSDVVDTDANERTNQTIAVCNYGNRTNNYTVTIECPSTYFCAAGNLPVAKPAPSSNVAGQLDWYNVFLGPSECWGAVIQYYTADEMSGSQVFVIRASWDNGAQSYETTREIVQDAADQSAPTTELSTDNSNFGANITLVQNSANQPIYVKKTNRGGNTGINDIRPHLPTMELPPGLTAVNLSATVTALPGYPVGSEKEGWNYKFASFGNILEGTGSLTYYVYVNVSATPDYIPGGKKIKITGQGNENAAFPRQYRESDQQYALQIVGPYAKATRRYYNPSSAAWENFPGSVGCGVQNASLEIYNVGNVNLTAAWLNESYPPQPEVGNFTPANSSGGSYQIGWGAGLAWNSSGVLNSSLYNYTFTPPIAPVTNAVFRVNVSNSTAFANYVGRPYYMNMTCNDIPQIANESATPQSSGFGSQKNFSAQVYSGYNALTVNLTRSTTPTGPWTLINQTTVNSPGSWAWANFTQSFSCSDLGTYWYNYTVYDDVGNANGSLYDFARSYTVLRDNVSFEYKLGNLTTANRSGAQADLLVVRVLDANGTYLPGVDVNLSVTYDGSTWGAAAWNTSDVEGNVSREYDPGCSPTEDRAGTQRWKAELYNSSCYTGASSEYATSELFYLTVNGSLAANITDPPKTNNNYTEGDQITLQGSVKDDCENPISTATTTLFANGTYGNYTCSPTDNLGSGFYRCYWASAGKAGGWYNVSMYADAGGYYSDYEIKNNTGGVSLFYLFGKPALYNPGANPPSTGWGVPINFTVNLSSPNALLASSAMLSLRCDGCTPAVSTYNAYPVKNCAGCVNETQSWNVSFNCSSASNTQVGTWNYNFTANTTEGQDSQTSPEAAVTVAKDNFGLFISAGNNSIANRSGESTVLFAVQANDTERGAVAATPAATVYFNATTDGSANSTWGVNTSNSTGGVDFNFNATCSHAVGPQWWDAFSNTSDACYKANQSLRFNVSVLGSFSFNVSHPVGEDYYVNENVTMLLQLQDECGNFVSGANVWFYLKGPQSNQSVCGGANLTDYANGTYGCVWNSSGMGAGYYAITANATKAWHNFGNYTKSNAVRLLTPLNNAPILSEAQGSKASFGWGENVSLSVRVQDPEAGTNNVSLYGATAGGGPYSWITNETCIMCGDSVVNFTVVDNYTCGDLGTRYFTFNATDDLLGVGSSGEANFTVEEDNTTAEYYSGNATSVNRSGSNATRLALRLYDSDNATYFPASRNGKIFVQTGAATFDAGTANTTNDSSVLAVDFNAACSHPVGPLNWTGGANGDSCYFDGNATEYLSLNVYGDFNIAITAPTGETVPLGENATLKANVTDECGNVVTGATVWFRVQHLSNYYTCAATAEEGSGLYNCTLNTSGMASGNYTVIANASKQWHNFAQNSSANRFHVENNATLAGEAVANSSLYWGSMYYFYVNVTDEDDNVTVQLWERAPAGAWQLVKTQFCFNCSNSQMAFTDVSHSSCANYGTWDYKFNATDKSGNVSTTPAHTFDLTRRNVSDVYVSGNESAVHRVDNATQLELSFIDVVDGISDIGTGVLSTLWVTTDGASYASAATNNSLNGIASIAFDPTCGWSVGRQRWKIGVAQTSCYNAFNSSEYNTTISTNALSNNVTAPSDSACYVPGTSITFNGTVLDECGNVAGAAANFFAQRGASSYACSPADGDDLGAGNYSCAWDSTGRSYGLYNITLNSSKADYASGTFLAADSIRLASTPSLSDPQVNASVEGWGYTRRFSVTASDADGDSPTVQLWVRPSGGNWELKGQTTCTSCGSDKVMMFNVSFACGNFTSNPDWEYKFNATDSPCGFNTETAVNTFTLQKDNVTINLGAGSATNSTREGEPASFLWASVADSDSGNSAVGGSVSTYVWVTTDGSNFDSGTANATNASGAVAYYFNATCGYGAKRQYWKASVLDDACYSDKNSSSTSLDVYGQLKQEILLPPMYGQSNVTDNVTVRFNVTSDCPSEGALSGAFGNVTFIHNLTSNTSYSCSPTQNETGGDAGFYNCTWPTTNQLQGNWTIRITANLSNPPATLYFGNLTTYLNWTWLENRQTNYTNLLVNSTSGGWGRAYQFNVTVNDPENDTVNCTLWTNTAGTWVQRGYSLVAGGQGNCSVVVGDFGCADIGAGGQYKFYIDDNASSEALNTTANGDLGLAADAVSIQYAAGNATAVNRSGGGSQLLAFRVWDDDKNSAITGDANFTVWTTSDGALMNESDSSTTNASGYREFVFDPGCGYSAGLQKWAGGTLGSACYVDANYSQNLSVTVQGALSATITAPNGTEISRNQNATLRANVSDDCSNAVADAGSWLAFVHQNSSTTNVCSSGGAEGDGNYNCSLNTTGLAAGDYTAAFNATKQFFVPVNVSEAFSPGVSGFWLESGPAISGATVSPLADGWGKTFFFWANSSDEDNDTVTIYAWYRQLTPSEGAWQLLGSNTTQGASKRSNFSTAFTSNDIGNWTAKFNATEDDAFTDETAEINFTVEKDDTQTNYHSGNETNVSRIGSNTTALRARVVDSDKPSNNINGQEARVWVATNGAGNYSESAQIYTNSTGYINYNFDPSCDFGVGRQSWKAGLLDLSSNWKGSNSSEFNVSVYSLFSFNFEQPRNQTFRKGTDGVLLRANLSDAGGCGLVGGATVKFVVATSGGDYVCNAQDEGTGWYNCTIAAGTHNSWDYGWYNVTVNASKAYYNDTNSSYNYSFYLSSAPQLSSVIRTSSGTGWGSSHNFSVTATDLDDNNVTVYLWKKVGAGAYELEGTQSCQPCSSTQLLFEVPMSCPDVGSNTYFFNASDERNYTANTSESVFSVQKDAVSLDIQSGAGASMGREGGETSLLALSAFDSDAGVMVVEGVNASFWVTTDGSVFGPQYITATNASGWVAYDFNATCSHSAGSQKWRGGVYNDSCYADSLSTNYTLTVNGSLKPEVDSPANGSVYNTTSSIGFRFNVTSDCPGEGALAGLLTSVELNSSAGSLSQCSPVQNETGASSGYYNCTWGGSTAQGAWDLRINASNSSAWNSNSTVFGDWFNLTNSPTTYSGVNVTPGSSSWTRPYQYSINVSDPDNNDVNCTLWTSTDGGSEWSQRGTVTIAGGNGICLFNVSNFGCSEIGTDNQFIFTVEDVSGAAAFHSANTSAWSGPNLSAASVQVQYVAGNESSVNRSGTNATTLRVRVYDTDNSSYLGGGVNVSFWATTDGASYASGNETTTNASGYANVSFNPSCSYNPAKQKWAAGTIDACYVAGNSSEYNVSVVADFNSSMLSPSAGAEFLRGESAGIRANLTDECNNPLASNAVNFTVKKGASNYACAPTEEGSGVYNCSFDTAGKASQYYNVSFNASKAFFNNHNKTYQNLFWVETGPVFESVKLNTSTYDSGDGPTGGYSEAFNFTINVTDEDADTVTAKLWLSRNGGAWSLAATKVCSSCSNSTLYFTKTNFLSTDIDSWEYKWNATEDDVWNSTTANYSFGVEKDDVQVEYFAGNESAIWRNGTASALLSTRVYDIDKQAYVGISDANTKVWATTNASNPNSYDSGATVATDTGGFVNYSFDPSGCTYGVGVQRWKVGTTGNSQYKDANSSAFYLTLNASLSTAIAQPSGQVVSQTESVPVAFTVSDECAGGVAGVSPTLFLAGPGSTYVVDSGIADAANGTYTYSFDTTGKVLGWYNFTAQSDIAYYPQTNQSSADAFRVGKYPELQLPSSNVTTGGWGEAWQFQVECRDTDGDVFNVTLWKKDNESAEWAQVENQTCNSTTNFQTLTFTRTFSCGEVSSAAYYKFNTTDSSGFGAETANNTIVVEKDDVVITLVAGQNSNVSREGASSVLLRVSARDQDKGGAALAAGVNGSFWVTTDGTVPDGSTINSTDSEGNFSLYFEPSCSYATGSQKWQGGVYNATCYKDKLSANYTVNVTGQLKAAVVAPAYLQEFNVTDTVLLRMNVTSDCAGENAIASSSAAFGLQSPLGAWSACTPVQNETGGNAGFYNCSWNTTGVSSGNWTLQLNASKPTYYPNSTTFGNWTLLLNAQPSASAANVSPQSGGWTRQYNYSVNLNDPAGETMNCSLLVSTDNQGTWNYKGSASIAGNGTCAVNVSDFASTDVGTDNYFLFQIEDVEPNNVFNTSAVQGPNLTASGVQVQYVSGNATAVNRTGIANTSNFAVRVYDTDNASYVGGGYNVTFWLTTDGATYSNVTVLQTNSSGYALLPFNPDCTFAAGAQKWIAGVTDTQFVATNASLEYNTTVFASLSAAKLSPMAEEYLRASNVSMRVNMSDECGATVAGMSVNLSASRTASTYYCAPTAEEGAGLYNCTKNTTGFSATWHNVSVAANKTYYNNYSAVFENAFFVETAPVLYNPRLNTSTYDSDAGANGSWEESFNFTVNVTDEDGDGVTAKLWGSKDGGAWQVLSTKSCSNCANTTLYFTKTNFACSDVGNWTYKWNASEDDVWNYSTPNVSFEMQKSDVQMEYFAGSESSIWRNGTDSALLSVRAYSIDGQRYLSTGDGDGKIWVTQNASDASSWDSGYSASTDSAGFLNYSFNPSGCGYGVGRQKWVAGTSGSGCFKDANSSQYNITLNASMSVTLSSPSGGATVNQTSAVSTAFTVRDECSAGIAGAAPMLFFKGPSTYVVDTGITDLANGTYTYSFDTTGKSLGWYNVTSQADLDYFPQANASNNNAFRIGKTPELQNPAVNVSVGGWGEAWEFSVDCRDTDGDAFNVTLWKKDNDASEWVALENQPCSSTNFQTLTFVRSFSCGEISPASYYKFNASDSSGFGTETANASITVEKDDVTVEYSQGQNAAVDREGGGTATLSVRLLDADVGNSPITFANASFFISTDGSVFDAGTGAQTDASGYATYEFDPTCSYSPGAQKWQSGGFNNTCYEDKPSANYSLNVTGQLNVNISGPAQYQEFNVTDAVSLRMNATSDCAAEGAVGGAEVSFNLLSPLGAGEVCTPVNNETGGNAGFYNCSWNTAAHSVGNWTIRLNASKGGFNPIITDFENWTLLQNAQPTYAAAAVSPQSGGWTQRYNFSVNVNDTAGEAMSCLLFFSNDGQSSWSHWGSAAVTGNGTCLVNVTNFTTSDIGTDNYFKFEIRDVEPNNYFNTTAVQGPNLSASSVQVQYVSGNAATVNRSGLFNTTNFTVRVYDSDNSTFVKTGVNVTFWATTDGSAYSNATVMQTNASGYAVLPFDPDCTFAAGAQKWIAGVTDSGYAATNSTPEFFNTTVVATISPSLLSPSSEEYLRGSSVSIRANLSDDCNVGLSGLTVNLSGRKGASTAVCTPISEEGSGVYNCSLATGSLSATWHNVSVQANKTYYNNRTSVFQNAFWVETAPVLYNPRLNTSTYDSDAGANGSWEESFNFTINATDEDGDGLTARLWGSKDGGAWQQLSMKSCSNCANTTLYFTKTNFACSDVGNWTYKWNASEDEAWNYSTENLSFALEKSDVEIQYVAGDGSSIWRNGSATAYLVARVYSIDGQRNLSTGDGAGKIWITQNASNASSWDAGSAVSTDSNGLFNYSFNPSGCGYGVGGQKWVAGTSGSGCYKNVNSSQYDVALNASMSVTLSSPSGGATVNQTSAVSTAFTVRDECSNGLAGAAPMVFFTGPSAYVVDSGITDLANGTYTYSFDTTGKSLGWYNATAQADLDYFPQSNASNNNAFRIGMTPELQNPSANVSAGGWGEAWEFSVDCRDTDGDAFNVTLWKKQNDTAQWQSVETQLCNSTNFNTLSFVRSFSCGEISPASYYKFNASDAAGFATETANASITVEKDDVTVEYSQGQNGIADREGASTVGLAIRVLDADKGNAPIASNNATFYVSTDGSVFDAGTVNQTTATGYAYYYFDPGCGYSAGEQKWQAGVYSDSCYKDKASSNYSLNVTGQLKVNVVAPSYLQVFNVSQAVPLRMNVTSDCAAEGTVSGAFAGFDLLSPNSTWEACGSVVNESGGSSGYYNCS
ncbi:MAG: hypothetical protein WC792_06500, partial [Candidatus Micrarchaeia archaeon]